MKNRKIICLKCGRETVTVKDELSEQLSKAGCGSYQVMACKHPDCDNTLFKEGFTVEA